MSVYVDNMRARFGRMVMCHMVADTEAELLEMADRIGVARRWHQQAGTHQSHFDICLAKRALAVRHGAIELTPRQLVAKCRAKKTRCALCGEPALPEQGLHGATGDHWDCAERLSKAVEEDIRKYESKTGVVL